jgi:pimeloyl-ACP methyl ester carboxylesterase
MSFLREVGFAAPVTLALMPLIHAGYAAWVRRQHPAKGVRFTHAGVPVHYVKTGSGPAVVLVHGANGTSGDFPPELISDLARDHTVIVLDRPGHGWSEAPRGPLGLSRTPRPCSRSCASSTRGRPRSWATPTAPPWRCVRRSMRPRT